MITFADKLRIKENSYTFLSFKDKLRVVNYNGFKIFRLKKSEYNNYIKAIEDSDYQVTQIILFKNDMQIVYRNKNRPSTESSSVFKKRDDETLYHLLKNLKVEG